MKHYKKIIGKSIYLSPFSEDDYISFTEWINDYETSKYLDQYSKIFTLEDEKDFVERARKDDKVYLSIVKLSNGLKWLHVTIAPVVTLLKFSIPLISFIINLLFFNKLSKNLSPTLLAKTLFILLVIFVLR